MVVRRSKNENIFNNFSIRVLYFSSKTYLKLGNVMWNITFIMFHPYIEYRFDEAVMWCSEGDYPIHGMKTQNNQT